MDDFYEWNRAKGARTEFCKECGIEPPMDGRRSCRGCHNALELLRRAARRERLAALPCAEEGCDNARHKTASQTSSYCDEHRREKGRVNAEKQRRRAGIPERGTPPIEIAEGNKYCWTCGKSKPLDDFHWRNKAAGERAARCKECSAEIHRATYDSDPEVFRERQRRHRRKTFERRFGVTWEQFQTEIASQGGRCLVCEREAPLRPDHCHESGRYRGAICDSCNTALGLLQDDPDVISRLQTYVETWEETRYGA